MSRIMTLLIFCLFVVVERNQYVREEERKIYDLWLLCDNVGFIWLFDVFVRDFLPPVFFSLSWLKGEEKIEWEKPSSESFLENGQGGGNGLGAVAQ